MSEKLCALRKIGGGTKFPDNWTQIKFVASNTISLTLSEIQDYKYIMLLACTMNYNTGSPSAVRVLIASQSRPPIVSMPTSNISGATSQGSGNLASYGLLVFDTSAAINVTFDSYWGGNVRAIGIK